jgi:protein-tyrosine kinase
MSRIYEALQRADLERKTATIPEIEPMLDTEPIAPEIEELAPSALPTSPQAPPAPPALVYTEEVVHRPWRPAVAALPTLEDRGAGVEQFRALRSRVYQARYEAPLKTILICSGLPSEGKSFVTANLTMTMARNSVNSILLIDGDLRRPSQHTLLGASNEIGLSDYLAGTAELKDIMQRDSSPKKASSTTVGSVANLTFIAAGKCGDNSAELVSNHRMEQLIATVAPHFDWILIDSPPVLAVTDAVELSHAADAVLLIARGASTPYEVAQQTQAAFSKSRILGFVLNDVKEAPAHGYGYYDYYGAPQTPSRTK